MSSNTSSQSKTVTVTVADGSVLTFEQLGPADGGRGLLLLVDGAFCGRHFGPMADLGKALGDDYRVVHYDRRGRGDSTDALGGKGRGETIVDAEIGDLVAVVDAARAGLPSSTKLFIYGTSSGAMLAARAVASGRLKTPVTSLVLYEPPLSLDGTNVPHPPDVAAQVERFLKENNRDGVVKVFMRSVGVPGFALFMMSTLMRGVWKKIMAAAHTLPHDFALLGDTQRGGPLPDDLRALFARITCPTAVYVGGKSPPYMAHTVEVVQGAIPGATRGVLPGQDHNASARAMAPVLTTHCV